MSIYTATFTVQVPKTFQNVNIFSRGSWTTLDNIWSQMHKKLHFLLDVLLE